MEQPEMNANTPLDTALTRGAGVKCPAGLNDTRQQMMHKHDNEYQIRTIHQDGTEELSAWMDGELKLAQAIAVVQVTHDRTFWLRVRSVPCSDCIGNEQPVTMECPIANLPSARCRPHDSQYLVSVGSRNRSELPDTARRGF